MNKFKKFMALGLAAMMVTSLVACGGSTGNAKNKKSDSSKGTTVTFWNSFTGADGDMLVKMVDKFNKENTDGIKVKMDISSDFDSQLSTAFAAGEGPTMILSSSAYRFTYGDYLQDVSDVFDKTDLNKDDFIQSYLDYCSDGDKTYFVPFQVVGYYMYWNKDLFKKAGLDPETPPTSWDEWQQDAAKISDSTKNIYGSGISYDYAYQIAHIMQRFGGLAVTDDNGTWKANFENNAGYENFLNMYKDMVDDGDNPLEADTDSMMSAGQVGITVGGPWVTAGLDTAGIEDAAQEEKDGYLYLKKVWNREETFCIDFPMEVQMFAASECVREDIGKAAIMRGPVVYCLEEKDNGKNLHELLVDTDMHASVSEGKICDTVVKMVETDGWRLTESGDAEETLYHMYQKPQKQKVRLHYIPYYTWANRGENEMQVWTRVQNP